MSASDRGVADFTGADPHHLFDVGDEDGGSDRVNDRAVGRTVGIQSAAGPSCRAISVWPSLMWLMIPLVLASMRRPSSFGNSRNWLMLRKGTPSAAASGTNTPIAVNKINETLQSAIKPDFS
jgi:hypothetical protein